MGNYSHVGGTHNEVLQIEKCISNKLNKYLNISVSGMEYKYLKSAKLIF